ncbi:MAG: N-ethylammeline chlorohydrolase [Candidatus Bathyarchaeota archaeon BA1]|nr:MAG: N-ethylammeline chlorohydrolase [Candidatus Bathyarchaeota archaeon BA1]
MGLIVDGGTIVTMGREGIVGDGVVIVENDRIIDVGKGDELRRKYSGYERMDAKGKVVIPGLINTHQHAAMSLLRGYADDLPLKVWLEDWIWPLEKYITGRDIYVGALLTAVESVMGGTTTVNSMYHHTADGNEAEAFAEVGLRGVIGHVCFSWRRDEDRKALWALTRDWHGKANGLLRVSVDPHAPYTVDPEYMKELRSIAKELNEKYGSPDSPIMWHTHIAETKDEPKKIREAFKVPVKGGVVEYLDSLGVLESDTLAAHCVWLSSKDITILKERGVKISHNPISNLKIGCGVSPVSSLLRAGMTVALGTDSSCSNNTADMFEVMKAAALLQKGVYGDPTLLPAEQALRMATIGGAEALLWDKQIGSIEVGKSADLVIIDFRKPHLCPLFNEIILGQGI